jgi:hypothetical protein
VKLIVVTEILIIKSNIYFVRMKKLLIVLTALIFACSVYAQKAEQIKSSELPKTTLGWLNQKFPGAPIEKAAKVSENKNVVGYCAVVSTKGRKLILVFDKNGNFIEKVKKIEDAQALLKPAQPATQPAKK